MAAQMEWKRWCHVYREGNNRPGKRGQRGTVVADPGLSLLWVWQGAIGKTAAENPVAPYAASSQTFENGFCCLA